MLKRALLASALLAALTGCGTSLKPKPTSADADEFVSELNAKIKKDYPEAAAAQWLSVTHISDDTQLLAAKINERSLGDLKKAIEDSARFDAIKPALKPYTERSIKLLKLSTSMPAPKDPAKLSRLTELATKLEGAYGAGKYCRDGETGDQCRDLGQLSEVLAAGGDYDAQLDAWTGWHNVARGMRADYQEFSGLVNEGAKELGYADAGEMWRAGYDMSAAEFEVEADRLWGQVKPLYEQLHCYVRKELTDQYGDKGHVGTMIPAHLTGNMWAQQWGNLYSKVEPYPGVSSLDVSAALQTQRDAEFAKAKEIALANAAKQQRKELTPEEIVEAGHAADLANAKSMAHRAEDFYVSLGMQKLPESFWSKAQFIQPRDRDVVCHASAWDMNYQGDVRIKMCITPTEEELSTIYHELGHVYYYLAYNKLPPLFQSGAHDGFHEAIGDTIVLSLTPKYLNSVGLVGTPVQSKEAVINEQMKLALDKIAFLPFGKLIDQWRWGVFSGRITPEHYNQAWWDLKATYQGVAPAVARNEVDFDPGAKYHVPGNTPYTRYFLAHILQFQFHRALCQAAGHTGPLHECSIYGNKEAGKRYFAMLEKGQSQPWQATLKELTGTEQMDATAIIDYFAPLMGWLKEQNKGQSCGWES
ncbi:peptidase M20 [Ahniella affigens]|uniref:Peptidase M20 n=1 Tax=Ahniella affigens TaxID=2021234 RepID=A0A2P1PQ82_9GAMM|nr:M2 family metallopeptidase [Ahniella affigens]AVP96999.1 peptidase M20 [Ahniella affigens]